MRGWQRLRRANFQRAERLFVAATLLGALIVGLLGPSVEVQAYALFVLWAALVGMMIPRLRDARASAAALDLAEQKAAGQRVVNHDVASALLTIEGGIGALRYLYHEGQTPSDVNDEVIAARVESIAHAVETEIRRIRRIISPVSTKSESCHAQAAVNPLVALHEATGAATQCDLGKSTWVRMSADDLARVVANLLDNCSRHAPGSAIEVHGLCSPQWYQLTIKDDGPGIDADVIDRAFEHGVSSRPAGGLGLYSVRSLVETAGGVVTVQSSSNGTAVQVTLPRTTPTLRSPVERLRNFQRGGYELAS